MNYLNILACVCVCIRIVLSASLRLLIASIVAGPDLVVLIMIARHPSAITIRKLKKKVYCLQVLEITWHTWGHTARLQVERERAGTWGSAFIGVPRGWEPRGSPAHSLLVNLKHKSGNLKLRKRKNRWTSGEGGTGKQPGSLVM